MRQRHRRLREEKASREKLAHVNMIGPTRGWVRTGSRPVLERVRYAVLLWLIIALVLTLGEITGALIGDPSNYPSDWTVFSLAKYWNNFRQYGPVVVTMSLALPYAQARRALRIPMLVVCLILSCAVGVLVRDLRRFNPTEGVEWINEAVRLINTLMPAALTTAVYELFRQSLRADEDALSLRTARAALDQHAVAAFEQGAIDYVLKPFSAERLALTVSRLKARIGSTPADLGGLLNRLRELVDQETHYLQWSTVSLGQELRLVTISEICYFRADEKYTAVVTSEAEHLIARALKQLCEQLDPKVFWRIHRSVIVNVNAIRSVHRDFRGRLEVRLKQRSETLPVSAAHAHQFRQI